MEFGVVRSSRNSEMPKVRTSTGRGARSQQAPDGAGIEAGVVGVVRQDHREIPVAVRACVAAGAAAEQPDLMGLEAVADAIDDPADGRDVRGWQRRRFEVHVGEIS
jgi:hypothetical protein